MVGEQGNCTSFCCMRATNERRGHSQLMTSLHLWKRAQKLRMVQSFQGKGLTCSVCVCKE